MLLWRVLSLMENDKLLKKNWGPMGIEPVTWGSKYFGSHDWPFQNFGFDKPRRLCFGRDALHCHLGSLAAKENVFH